MGERVFEEYGTAVPPDAGTVDGRATQSLLNVGAGRTVKALKRQDASRRTP